MASGLVGADWGVLVGAGGMVGLAVLVGAAVELGFAVFVGAGVFVAALVSLSREQLAKSIPAARMRQTSKVNREINE